MTEKDYEEGLNCRVLLLEIIRRAAYDWVLYRNSRRLENRKLAHDAFTWLFVETPNHAHWQARKKEGYETFAFLNICEVLGLDVEQVRQRLRTITPHDIQNIGRPPTRRKLPPANRESDYIDSATYGLSTSSEEVTALLESGEILDLE